MRPLFPDGTVTAGNASGINDGAAALLLASAAGVRLHGLQPVARLLGMAVAGVPPRIMGIGPVPATRKLLERLGLGLDDFDILEFNEAFAAQALAIMSTGMPLGTILLVPLSQYLILTWGWRTTIPASIPGEAPLRWVTRWA